MAVVRPPELTLEHVRRRYNERVSKQAVDTWHTHTARTIERILTAHFASHPLPPESVVLFAGSGGRSNSLECSGAVHVDIAESALRDVRGVVGDIERLPLAEGAAAAIVCVGSVINYCDASAAIVEMARVIQPKGKLVLEFESSDSLEFLFTPTFRRPVDFVSTFYNSEVERIWVYSRRYIEEALRAAGFRITERHAIHLISSLRLRFSSDDSAASRWTFLDSAARRVPVLRDFACNFVLFCEKDGHKSRTKERTR